MNRFSKKIKIALLLAGDTAILYLSLYTALTLRNLRLPENDVWKQHLLPFSLAFAVWLIIFMVAGLFDLKTVKNGKQFLEKLLRITIVNSLLAIMLFYLIPYFRITPKTNLFSTIIISASLIFAWRFIFNAAASQTNKNRILFFGITKETIDMADYLKYNPQFGYLPAALMAAETESTNNTLPYPVFSFDRGLEHIIKDYAIDTIVVSENIKENKTFVKMFFEIIPYELAIIDFPEFYENITGKIPISLIQETWFLEHLVGGRNRVFEILKRTADVILSIFFLLIMIILLPFVALAIRLDSEGSVFFRQKRVGKNNREFHLLKFRSMVKNAEEMSGFKGKGKDPRHTKIGAIIRKSYLDELPQIWNILKGEMSFVGPRPERPEYVRELKKNIPFYEMRLLARPGITGWAQINMENDASVEDAPEKMQYDLYYIKNKSFLLDLNIILKTGLTILSRGGR